MLMHCGLFSVGISPSWAATLVCHMHSKVKVAISSHHLDDHVMTGKGLLVACWLLYF